MALWMGRLTMLGGVQLPVLRLVVQQGQPPLAQPAQRLEAIGRRVVRLCGHGGEEGPSLSADDLRAT